LRIFISVFGLSFFLLGCFPQGLPEYVLGQRAVRVTGADAASQSKMRSLMGRAAAVSVPVFLVPGNSERSLLASPPSSGGEILGFQYVLGFIPLTRLYYQRGVERLSHELLADLLYNQGASPYAVSERYAALAARTLRPRQILRMQVSEPSVDGFDAFFFRYLSVDANVELSTLELQNLPGGDTGLVGGFQVVERMSDSSFRQYAHTPALSFMFEESLSKSLKDMLDRIPPRRRSLSLGVNKAGTPSLVVMSMPRMRKPVDENFSRLVSASYGYSASRGYSELSLARMMQRGMTYVATERELPIVVMLHQGAAPSSMDRIILLEVEILEIGFKNGVGDIDDELRVVADLRMSELDGGIARRTLLNRRCYVSEKPDDDIDGSWVDALERAGEDIFRAYLDIESKPDDTLFCEGAPTSRITSRKRGN
jgi:hypothetical protein